MKKKFVKIIIEMLIILSIISSYSIVTAMPIDVKYSIDPEKPTPLSEVKIIAEISDDGISSVFLEMQECDTKGTCFGWETNVSMQATNNKNEYMAKIKLNREDTKYFSIRLAIDKGGVWEYSSVDDYYDVQLDRSGVNGNDNNSNTPGFEIILLLFAVAIGIGVYKRKR